MYNEQEDYNYTPSRKDIYYVCLLGIVIFIAMFLNGKYGCDNHDPKPQCQNSYQANQ